MKFEPGEAIALGMTAVVGLTGAAAMVAAAIIVQDRAMSRGQLCPKHAAMVGAKSIDELRGAR